MDHHQAALPFFRNQMDWLVQMLLFGFLALLLFALSLLAFRRKKYAPGLAFAGLELLSAVASCNAWHWALWTSGKADWGILGLRNYPPIALLCYAMFLAGAGCVVLHLAGLLKNRNMASPTV